MHPLVSLAKSAVEKYISEGKIITPPENFPKEFLIKKAGTFVTIEKELQGLPRDKRKRVLRGCIGTYLPTKNNIAEEVISNAIAASSEDYRFGKVEKEELPFLAYTVYILGELEKIKDLKELNPKKYGIIVKTITGFRTGVLLPDLEGVDAVRQQIAIACEKGGIDPSRDDIIIYRFKVKKYQQNDK